MGYKLMYQKIAMNNHLRQAIRVLLDSKKFKINENGKLVPYEPKGTITTPWIFTNAQNPRRKFCNEWNNVYCGIFKLIPEFCRFHCWKTVVYPNNVYELFQLAELLQRENVPSKCGADKRNYTYHAWGGYIYGDTLKQGESYYKKIRRAVDEEIDSHVEIILKRGCTEMERLHPSNTWDDWTEKEKELEFQLNDIFELDKLNFHQSDWVKRDIKEGWILRAIEIRDPSVAKTIEDYGKDGLKLDNLIVKSITYQDNIK